MFFPLKGDEKFLRNLKKGTPLYICEASWNPNKGEMDVLIKTIFFDHYDNKKVAQDKENRTVLMAVLTKNNIQTESHNILYGFYETPMKALESMKQLYSSGLESIESAIKSENKRLNGLAKDLIRATNKKSIKHESPKVEFKKD